MANARIRPRGDTAANWSFVNPVLESREIAVETDTFRVKIGDGVTAWASLPYISPGSPGDVGKAVSRAVLSAITGQVTGQTMILVEAGREGTFAFDSANHATDVTNDPQQARFVAPASSPTGNLGAWVRRTNVMGIKHFGGISDGATDSGTALNAFLSAAANDRSFKYYGGGDWATGVPLTLDPGTLSSGTQTVIDWGNGRIAALTSMQRLLTVQDNFGCRFQGRLHLRGTNFGSDAHSAWGVDVGMYANNVGTSVFDQLYIEGFAYAGIESEGPLSSNDSVHWGNVQGARIGSGAPLSSRCQTANWSNPVFTGSYGALQTVTITVDSLPYAYAALFTPHGAQKQILVEISGVLYFVNSFDAANSTLTLHRWFPQTLGTSGTLKYHYGAMLVLRGSDSNIDTFSQVSVNGGSTGVEIGCLYGPSGQIVHTEGCGSNVRIGIDPGSILSSGTIGLQYCEGNTFNTVVVGQPGQFTIAGRPATGPASKDVSLQGLLATGDVFPPTALAGITTPAPTAGWYYPKKVAQYASSSVEGLDFNKPAAHDKPVYWPPDGIITLNITAPDASLNAQERLDSALVIVGGPKLNNAPLQVTLVPPSGHTINGGAASASAVFKGFDSIGLLWFNWDGNTTWKIEANNPADGNAISYDTNSSGAVTLTVGTNNKTEIFSTALTANRTVTLSTSNATNGNRFRVVRASTCTGAFNLTVNGVALTAAGQWIEFMFDGTAWVEIASGTLL